MFKTAIATLAALLLFHFRPVCCPCCDVNVEPNASWTGDNYTGATTDFHVGLRGRTRC